MSLIRKGIVTTAGKGFAAAIMMVNGIILARTLGPTNTGHSVLVASFSVLFGVICGLGIGQASIFLINNRKIPVPVVTMHLLWITGIWFPTYALLQWFSFLIWPDYFGNLPWQVTLSVCFGSALMRMVNAIMPLLLAELRAFDAALLEIVQSAAILVITVALALSHRLTLNASLAAPTLAYLLATGFAIWKIRGNIARSVRFDPQLVKSLLLLGLQLASVVVAVNAHAQAPLLLMRKLVPTHQGDLSGFDSIGFYSRAASVCGLISIMGTAAAPLLYSRWSGQSDTEARARQAELATRLYSLLGMAIAVFAAVGAPYIMMLLYGRAFLPAAPLLRILAFSTAIQLVANVLQTLFPAMGRPMIGAGLFTATLIVNVALCLVLIPRFDAMGASIAMLVASCVYLISAAYLGVKLCGVRIANCFIPRREDVARLVSAVNYRKSPPAA